MWALDSRSPAVQDALSLLVDRGRLDYLQAMEDFVGAIEYDGDAREWPEWTGMRTMGQGDQGTGTDIARFCAVVGHRRLALALVFPPGVRVPRGAEYWVHFDGSGTGSFDSSVRFASDGTLSWRQPVDPPRYVTLGSLITTGNALEVLLPEALTACFTQPSVRLRFVGPLRGDDPRQIIEGVVPLRSEVGPAVSLLREAALTDIALDTPLSATVLAELRRLCGTLATVRRSGDVATVLDDGGICAPVERGPGVRPEAVGRPGFSVPLASRAFLRAGGYSLRDPDPYDFLIFFVNFPIYGIPWLAPPDGEKGGAHHPVHRAFGGLGTPLRDLRPEHGSWGSLQGVLAMNTIHRDPHLQGARRVLWFMQRLAHECSHLWSVFAKFDADPGPRTVPSDAITDALHCHWSIFTRTVASLNGCKPGAPHELCDLGNGTFALRRAAGNWTFTDWDLYLMGFIPRAEVAPTFVVLNPSVSEAQLTLDQPFRGTRHDVTVDDVIAIEGPRLPDWGHSQKDFRAAFVLVTRGEMPTEEEVAFVDTLRREFETYWHEVTRGLSTMDTRLDP